MRVLFIYRYLTLGGVETVLRARLDKLPDFGIDAQVWFFRDGPGRAIFDGFEDKYHVGDLVDLRRYLERTRPSVLSTIDSPEVLSILDDLSFSPHLTVEVHSPYPENRLYLHDLDLGRVAAFVAPTKYQAQVISSALSTNALIRTVPNPVQEAFLTPIREADDCQSVPIVGWIGRLDRLKNWEALLQVGVELLRREVGIEIWVIGRGGSAYAESRFVRTAVKKRVLSKMRWFRDLPYAQMPRWYDAVRSSGGLVLSTSRGESFGMTVAEAMARACSVVVPNQSPFDEFVAHRESGYLYQPGSADKAADAIQQLLSDTEVSTKLGHAARLFIKSEHNPRKAAKALADFLISLR